MQVAILLVAAGKGERLGRGPKAFVEVGGRSLLDWSLRSFRGLGPCWVALPEGYHLPDEPGVHFIPGGPHRQASVFRLLERVREEWVLVHDVARPFVPREAIERLLAATLRSGAATLALPIPDTLVEAQGPYYGTALPRERYRLIQTPQGFRRELLLEAHRKASKVYSDDAQLVLALGHPVTLVEGDPRAFKITYPQDLILAEGLARWSS